MAALEIQGANVGFYVRDFGSTDVFKRMVCEETLIFDASNDVTTTKTKCGTFKGVQVADFKANGSGTNNFTPGAAEYSYDDLLNDQIAIQKKEFVIQNEAFSTYTVGELVRLAGGGYFVTSQETFNNGEVVKYTWNFEVSGTITTTES